METTNRWTEIEKELNRLRSVTARDVIGIRMIITELIDEMGTLLKSKGGDYSSIYTNEFGAPIMTAAIKGSSVHDVFTTLISLKMSRAINISLKEGAPNHETLLETWRDLLNYIVLWLAYTKFRETEGEGDEVYSDSSN